MRTASPTPAIEAIDPSALGGVTGGGLFGAAFKAVKGAYHFAKPIVQDVSPFAYVAYKANSLWHKVTNNH
jgi:hypothetical protein